MSNRIFRSNAGAERGTLRYLLLPDTERSKVDAEEYRLMHARNDLSAAGFIEQADGTWLPGDDS